MPTQLPHRSPLLSMFPPYNRSMYPRLLSHPPPHIAQASEYTVDKADVVVEDAAAANMVTEVAGDEVTSVPRLLTIYVTCNKRG